MPNTEKWVDLLFVQDGAYRQVVAVPASVNVCVGDLVEYIMPGNDGIPERTSLGLVVKVMLCELLDNAYLCVAEIAEIRQAKAVYSCRWNREAAET